MNGSLCTGCLMVRSHYYHILVVCLVRSTESLICFLNFGFELFPGNAVFNLNCIYDNALLIESVRMTCALRYPIVVGN